MGILNKIKNAFTVSDEQKEFSEILKQSIADQLSASNHFFDITMSEIGTYTAIVENWDDSKKTRFIIYLCQTIKKADGKWKSNQDLSYRLRTMAGSYIVVLLKCRMTLTEYELAAIFEAFKENASANENTGMEGWPLNSLFSQIEHNYPHADLPETVMKILESIVALKKDPKSYSYKAQVKLDEKIKSFLYKSSNSAGQIKPTCFIGKDGFTDFANNLVSQQSESDKVIWYKLITIAQKATGSKPSQKYLKDAKSLIDELGSEKFKKVTHQWFDFVIGLKETVTNHTTVYDSTEYHHSTTEFLDPFNSEALKGFVWMSSWFHDHKTITTIGSLAERCFKKIPGKGHTAAAVGNACLFTLYSSKGLDGIAQLSKLKIKIKQNSTVDLIENYISEAARKLGITATEVEDLAVDDYKLSDFKTSQSFGDYTCVTEITGIGKSSLRWFKPDGSEQKTVPQVVKDKFADKLKKVKDKQKQINLATSVQKERFDRMLRSNRIIQLEYFKDKYLTHGLLSFIINKVIFQFASEDESKTAICIDRQWIGLDYKEVDIENFSQVSLWHPVNSSTNEVKKWRKFLMDGKIQQPFKQAYREIYLLTDAEVNTRTYSNRMASHILKQHQYVTLAKGRNWKSRLIGAWDGGDMDTAELFLPEFQLKAEYWVNALNADNQYNDTGIWNYVTTDQVRFINTETNEVVELTHVPPVAFSEVMRDVDLFVGVASVGNDPTWSDSGGLPAYRDYWQAYSFGDLSEVAKNRKEILSGLIPRLKIAAVTSIVDKFVVVKGKLRTYKIHIGSTNILMEPNDQYLCIVADRTKKNEADNIFIPFDGDNGLSVIISKAFLLANDDKITDTTITSQINR